jgi:hypothetical protein
MFDRLLLFGWLLPQRDSIGLSCEGVMRQAGGARSAGRVEGLRFNEMATGANSPRRKGYRPRK